MHYVRMLTSVAGILGKQIEMSCIMGLFLFVCLNVFYSENAPVLIVLLVFPGRFVLWGARVDTEPERPRHTLTCNILLQL